MATSIYQCPDGTDFPVDWPDPEMERHAWRWDQLHCPQPLTPLSLDFQRDLHTGFRLGFDRSGAPVAPHFFDANGYSFSRAVPFGGDQALRSAIGEKDRAERIDHILELWEAIYRPEVEALTRALRSFDDPLLSLRELVDQIEQVEAIRRRLGELHMLVLSVSNATSGRFIEFCTTEFGADGRQLAMEAMGGILNKSTESGMELWTLSREVQSRPDVERLLRESRTSEFLRDLAGVAGGESFASLLDQFLNDYGIRNESFTELSNPTWKEDPTFVLFMLRSYMDLDDDSSPAALHQRTVDRRLKRTEEARERLKNDPEKLARFDAWQTSAQQHTVLLEDHNFYIDQRAASSARVPCLAIADRLVEQGALADREDVFYLRKQELRGSVDASQADFKALVAERRADRDRWMRVLPPSSIGEGKVMPNPQTDGFFGPADVEPGGPGTVNGLAGSPGIVRGTARLVLSLSEVDRLQPGDILVTYATAPPWTPLFAVAGGIVTDAGGVLSHCAVVAREYSIPAVVGSKVATARIPDGALITVDGNAGTVTIHD